MPATTSRKATSNLILSAMRNYSNQLLLTFGRPGGFRTPNTRFWRPILYQLSYWPKTWKGRREKEKGPNPSPFTPLIPLLDNLCNHTCADGTTAFADRETQTFFHRDRVDQADGDADIVAGHDHFGTRWQFDRAGHIGGAEVELWAVALEERSMTAAFILAQHVDLGSELGVRGDGAGLGQHLAAFYILALGAAQQDADVVACLTLVEQLAEHFYAGADGFLGGF